MLVLRADSSVPLERPRLGFLPPATGGAPGAPGAWGGPDGPDGPGGPGSGPATSPLAPPGSPPSTGYSPGSPPPGGSAPGGAAPAGGAAGGGAAPGGAAPGGAAPGAPDTSALIALGSCLPISPMRPPIASEAIDMMGPVPGRCLSRTPPTALPASVAIFPMGMPRESPVGSSVVVAVASASTGAWVGEPASPKVTDTSDLELPLSSASADGLDSVADATPVLEPEAEAEADPSPASTSTLVVPLAGRAARLAPSS